MSAGGCAPLPPYPNPYPAAATPVPLTHVCGAAAASRQVKMTAMHLAADEGHTPCVESLLEAGADASLKDIVSDGAEGRGGRPVGGRGEGRGWGMHRRLAPALSPCL